MGTNMFYLRAKELEVVKLTTWPRECVTDQRAPSAHDLQMVRWMTIVTDSPPPKSSCFRARPFV
jgi:hypothetical protein